MNSEMLRFDDRDAVRNTVDGTAFWDRTTATCESLAER